MKKAYVILTLIIMIVCVGCSKVIYNTEYQKSSVEQTDKEIEINSGLEDSQICNDIEIEDKNESDNSEVNEDKDDFNDDISSFIPEGWTVVNAFGGEVVEGDLNNDNLSDIAFVIEDTKAQESAGQRTLIIITGNNDGTYNLEVKAEKAIKRSDEGGMVGESFMGLEINRGSLLVNHYGGSAWRWSSTYRFRFEDNGWYMIGATEDWFHATSNAGRRYEDINLITGDFINIETDDNGVEKKTEGNRGKKPLVNLENFDINGERQF